MTARLSEKQLSPEKMTPPGRQAAARTLVQEARACNRQSKRCYELLTEACEIDPYNFQAWFERALTHHENGQFEEAHHTYLQALRLFPDHAQMLAHHGLLVLEAYRADPHDELLELALQRFEAAHHCDPKDLLALFGLIDVHLETQSLEITQRVFMLLRQVPVGRAHARGFVARFLKLIIALRRLGQENTELLGSLAERLWDMWEPVQGSCQELKWLQVAVEIMTADVNALPQAYPQWREAVQPGGMVYLLVNLRLNELNSPKARLRVVERMLEQRPSDPFLRRDHIDLLPSVAWH